MQTKRCSRCGIEKAANAFHRRSDSKDGLQTWCRACQSEHHRDIGRGKTEWEKIRSDPARYQKQREAQRRTRLKNRYGLTEADFNAMVVLQAGKCALCLRDPGYRLFVDHCHATGKVRGLLCSKCNGALGWFENNRDRIVDYLVWTRESQILELMWATNELVPPEGVTSEC